MKISGERNENAINDRTENFRFAYTFFGGGGGGGIQQSYYSQFMIIFNYIAHGSYLLFN